LLSKEYDQPGGTKEQAAIKRLAKSLTDHLGLIYYRFLDASDERERNVVICIQGEPVAAWNPFFVDRADQVLPEDLQTLQIETVDGREENVSIRAWLLPSKREMTKEEEAQAKISNKGQGFYIHREGRVIQSGGWLGVFGVNEPHYSLIRIEFDFDHKLDDAFKVDVKKSHILFDPALAEHLKEMLIPFYREARNRYDRKEKSALIKKGIDHSSTNKTIEKTPGAAKPSVMGADPDTNTITVANNRGADIKLRVPVDTHVNMENIHIAAVDDIRSGNLWEPAMRSASETGFVSGVRLNKHHDFYQKIYQRTASSGYAIEGMDLLLWAFAVAEQNNISPELESIFVFPVSNHETY